MISYHNILSTNKHETLHITCPELLIIVPSKGNEFPLRDVIKDNKFSAVDSDKLTECNVSFSSSKRSTQHNICNFS